MKLKTSITLISSFFALAAYSSAQTVTVSAVQPTTDGNDISSNLGNATGSSQIWGDRGMKGNTFTTGTSLIGGWQLNSVSYQVSESDGTILGWKDYRVRVSTVSDDGAGNFTATPMFDGIGRYDPDAATDSFFTFAFDTPVSLNDNTLYAFSVGISGSQEGWGDGIPNVNTGGDNYAGGQFFSTGRQDNIASMDPAAMNFTSAQDLVFAMDLVPEPSTLALVGFAGLGLLRRRRR